MIHSRSSYFLIYFCIYLMLVVAGIIPDQAESLNGSKRKSSILNKLQSNDDSIDTCYKLECINGAMNILKYMNSDVQPCDDFYAFACQGFLNSTTIPDGKGLFGQRNIARDLVMKQLRTIMKKKSSPKEPRSYRLAKDFYKSCINGINTQNESWEPDLQPLLDNLKKLGGWPVLEGDNWKESDFNLTDSVYKFHELGYSVNYFIKVHDYNYQGTNYSKEEIFLYPPPAESNYYIIEGFDSRTVENHYKYMVDVAVLLGANRSRATVEMGEVVEFESMLANISGIINGYYDYYNYDEINMNQLLTNYPSIPWLEYLNAILIGRVQLNQNNTVNITSAYLRDLELLISRTPKKVLANYVLWRAVDEPAERRIIKDIVQLQKESGWKKCVNVVSNHLDLSVGSMYFNQYVEKDIWKIISDVKNAFKNILEKSEWMDQNTKANALEKLTSMKLYIIYPDEFLDIKKLDEFYEKLELNDHNFAEDEWDAKKFETNNTVDKEKWWRIHSTVTKANALHVYVKNSVIISAPLTQSIFFNNNRPATMNYGKIGFIVAHEIIHGFDNIGILHDKTGKIIDWLPPQTKENFLNRTECLVDQYGNYAAGISQNYLNGTQTLNENIADNAGVKVAYYAYKEWAKTNGRGKKLPGLPYNPEQIFWISFANSWCTKYTDDRLLTTIISGRHSPPEFRVNGALSNMIEFSRDFNCKIGSRMNPVKKCEVW